MAVVATSSVEGRILVIRGHQVMLDQDLAELYGVEPGALTQAVRRNKERFPDNFLFRLSKKKWENLKSQTGISSSGHGGRCFAPYAFTEQEARRSQASSEAGKPATGSWYPAAAVASRSS